VSIQRLSSIERCTLVATLTALWLWWNPRYPDCGEGEGDVSDPFERTVREPSAPAVGVVAQAHLEVEYGRCEMVMLLPGGDLECIYEPSSELRLWVVHPRVDEVEVSVDGRPWPAPVYGEPGEPGQGFRVEITGDGAQRLSVRVPGEEPWVLPLRASTRLTDDERSTLARFEQRGLLLEAHLTLGRLEVLPYTEALVEELLARGMLTKAVNEVLIAAYHLTQRPGRPDRAQALIEQLPPLRHYPRGHAATSIYLGNALQEQGRLVDAAVAYRDGARYALRMGELGLQVDALSRYASVLAELGYFDAAARWGARVLPVAREQARLADQVSALITVGRANLQLREAGQAHDDPGPWFDEALGIFEHEGPAADLGEIEPLWLGLATLAVLEGKPTVGLEWLKKIDPTRLTSAQRVDVCDTRLRALVAMRGTDDQEDQEEIREGLADLEAAARRAVTPRAQWRAVVCKGVVLQGEGDLAGAQAAYEEAEALLDRMIPLGWLGVAGGLDVAGYAEGTERLVALLLQQRRAQEALCVARWAQARRARLALLFRRLDPRSRDELRPRIQAYRAAMYTYEELLRSEEGLPAQQLERANAEAKAQQQWLERKAFEILSTPTEGFEPSALAVCERLSPREPGELLLALYPHLGDLLILVHDDDEITHRVIAGRYEVTSDDAAQRLGTLLLDPLGERLRKARWVRVLAAGRAAGVPVHALPWQERPLAVQTSVVYGLELPAVATKTTVGTAQSAMVIEDPTAKGTHFEATAVTRMLRDAGWAVQHEGSTAGPAHLLRQELGEVDHLHYAGHARYGGVEQGRWWPPYPGGAPAEASYVPLGKAGRLSVQDVLMMERVPRTVVLMGCNTGVHDERMAYGGFSLATAFVAAGAAAVVASTEEVNGTEASLVGQGLYEQLIEGVVGHPGVWFRDGLRWAQEQGLSDRAVRDYRVYVP
jgi:tetratricopeptide (TPR) repeat protein